MANFPFWSACIVRPSETARHVSTCPYIGDSLERVCSLPLLPSASYDDCAQDPRSIAHSPQRLSSRILQMLLSTNIALSDEPLIKVYPFQLLIWQIYMLFNPPFVQDVRADGTRSVGPNLAPTFPRFLGMPSSIISATQGLLPLLRSWLCAVRFCLPCGRGKLQKDRGEMVEISSLL